MILTFTWAPDDVLTNVTTALLSDPTGTYGVKRTDTDATVVADATAFVNDSTGTYSYDLTEPAVGLTYEYYVEIVYAGQTFRFERSVTGAGTALVTTANFKTHARITTSADDTYVDTLIAEATDWCEHYSGRRFQSKTEVAYLDAFPDTFDPKWSNAASVTSIQYVDTAGDTQTLATSLYQVDSESVPIRIAPAFGEAWPATREQYNAVTVTYVAGWATPSLVPQRYISAVNMLAASKYNNREATAGIVLHEVPYGVLDLLGIDRVFTL